MRIYNEGFAEESKQIINYKYTSIANNYTWLENSPKSGSMFHKK